MAPSSRRTIVQALQDLDVSSFQFFEACDTRDDEFKRLRKQFHKAALRHHPDKGGDPATFRDIKTSYDLLQDLHTGKQQVPRRRGAARGEWLFAEFFGAGNKSYGTAAAGRPNEASFDMGAYFRDFFTKEPPSWEYYQDAAEEELPTYRVERAKSGRSKCTATGKAKNCFAQTTEPQEQSTDVVDLSAPPERIAKDELRVGWLNSESGSYGGWRHIRCWRVPSKLWEGLPDPNTISDASTIDDKFHAALLTMSDCVLSGYEELPISDQRQFIQHLRDKSNWAALRKKKKKTQTEEEGTSTTTTAGEVGTTGKAAGTAAKDIPAAATNTKNSSSLVPHHGNALVFARQRFVTPQPGVNGCSDATVFNGKRFCLTGLFPEIGGVSLAYCACEQCQHDFWGAKNMTPHHSL